MNDLMKQVEDFAKPFCDQDPEDSKLWGNHVRLVRRFALQLADIEGADSLVCEIAAILHDIGKDQGRKGHNVRSHELAQPFVAKLAIADSQKALILKCILKHSSEFSSEDNEIEVKVLQSADALGVFFDEDWQAYSREVLQKDDLLGLYDKTFNLLLHAGYSGSSRLGPESVDPSPGFRLHSRGSSDSFRSRRRNMKLYFARHGESEANVRPCFLTISNTASKL